MRAEYRAASSGLPSGSVRRILIYDDPGKKLIAKAWSMTAVAQGCMQHAGHLRETIRVLTSA